MQVPGSAGGVQAVDVQAGGVLGGSEASRSIQVTLSAAMSLDGCIDGESRRIVLSGPEDAYAVHAARAEADAILVGAGTVRCDNPRLTVRHADLIRRRLDNGQPAQPLRIILVGQGSLDTSRAVFAEDGQAVVLCPESRCADLNRRLGSAARIAGLATVSSDRILQALAGLGIRSVLVEGGTQVLSLFLHSGHFHRLRLAVAPFFVGEPGAPRLSHSGRFRHDAFNRLVITKTYQLGNVAVLEMVNPQQPQDC
jgi:5-amino-6-(5-phosphoribosylamino)uracil reductase